MNIGQVLEQLRADFPGITIPKIRFLEDKGLIKPERTPAGYRKFSPDDVERLRYVLRMQRDHYLPLKVIGEHLDAIDRGLEPPPIEGVVPTVPQVALAADGLPSPESFARTSDVRLSRMELLKIAEVSDELLTQLEQFGLIAPRTGTRPLRHRRAGRRAARPASSPTSASSPGTCAPSRPPPTARSGSSSRSSRPSSAAATPARAAGRPTPSARSPRCPCACTPRSSRPACGVADRRLPAALGPGVG